MHFTRRNIHVVAAALCAVAALLATAAPAAAQRVGSTQYPRTADGYTRRFPGVAYDEANDAYLVSWGLQSVGARFVGADGTPLGSAVQVNVATGGASRVACGEEINACLIVWIQEPNSVVGRLVRYNGGSVQFLSDPFTITSATPKLS